MKKGTYLLMAILLLGGLLLTGCKPIDWIQEKFDFEEDVEDEIVDDEELDDEEDVEEEIDDEEIEDIETLSGEITFSTISQLDTEWMLEPYKEANITALMESDYGQWLETEDEAWEYLTSYAAWYEVGEFTDPDSDYYGEKLLVFDQGCDGMCFQAFLHRFAWDETTGELTHLTSHSNDYQGQWVELFDNSDNRVFEELDLPETISGEGWAITLGLEDIMYRIEGLGSEDYELFSHNDQGDIYHLHSSSSCFYVERPDGSVARYDMDPGFFDDDTEMVTWDDGTSANLAEDYYFSSSGCGVVGACYSIEDVTIGELEAVGKTDSGYTLYMAKDSLNAQDEASPTDAQSRLVNLYDGYASYQSSRMEYDDTAEPADSFEEFVNNKAFVYWQDDLGRFGGLLRNDSKLPAECGKPVIYLYPETTMDVAVQVDVDEFTVTEPDYGDNGWLVSATPESELYNYADGETYPYLFWEAHDYDKVAVDKGFVWSRKALPKRLPAALDAMGFTAQEKADFLEFWQPRILANETPYFFVTFLGTDDFNQIAPLTITPSPDQLIRVFMYYEPLDHYKAVLPLELKAQPRYGFTVFEWGGTSSVPWENE